MASPGPTMISQSGRASVSSPRMRATLPGMISRRWLTLPSMPHLRDEGGDAVAAELARRPGGEDAQPARFLHHSQAGTLLLSTSEATRK